MKKKAKVLIFCNRSNECRCGSSEARPIAASIVCNMSCQDMDWSVIKALVAAGHVLPLPINKFSRARHAHNAPLRVVRWLLQQGMTFDDEMLRMAAQAGRVDILQLAHSMRVPITLDTITAAARKSHWEVLVWACRNGVPVECTRILHLLRHEHYISFTFDEQKAELVSLLQDVQQQVVREEDADGAKRAQKRRKSKS